MNLGEQLAKILLEQDKQTIALFPGAFKPPHKGHVDVVKKLLDKADQVVILVSPKMRDGVSAEESVAVWNLYKKLFDGPIEVRVSANDSPVGEVYDVVKNNLDTDFIVAFGKGEESRYANMANQPNATVFDGGTIEGANATNLRMALAAENKDEITKYLPSGITVEEFLNAINEKPVEEPVATPAAEPAPAAPAPETPLQESPPVDDMNDDYYNYVESNRDKIEKIAQVFNYPIDDMLLAFQGGTPMVMSDDMWSALENSESHKIKDLEGAISHALKLGINPRPYIDQIKKKKQMPLPLVLQYNPGKFYLVGGEVVLSILKALGAIPEVLVGNITPKTQTLPEPLFETVQGKLTENQTATLGKFIKYAVKDLGIQKPPSGLTVSYDTNKARKQSTFGTFNPDNNKIWLYVGNRNMADILRTLAHELVHRKQAEDGRLNITSGETGSDIENEANAQAGILLRNFGKLNKQIYQ
jgi:cytidyltransferase-like protein